MTRAWRIIGSSALILAAASILLSALLYTRIQDERARNIRTSCVETNKRHDDVIQRYDNAINSMPPGARQQRAIRARDQTEGLLNAIVPYHDDCAAYARKIVSGPQP